MVEQLEQEVVVRASTSNCVHKEMVKKNAPPDTRFPNDAA